MGFLSGLFHSRDKPTNSTNGSTYRFLFGSSNSGKSVNERSAMQMTAVYACVRILSESIAGLPVHIYKYTDSGSKEKAIKHPLYRLIQDEPNPKMTSFVFRETLMTHLLLYGNAYAQIIRNGKGEVIALYPLMANRMSVDRDDKGHLYYQYQMQDPDAPTMKNGTVILKPSDVLHIPGLGFDGLVGYSPIAMAKNAIGLAIATEESIINAYEIKTGMSRAKLSHLMDAETWMDAHTAIDMGFADEILTRPAEIPVENNAAGPMLFSRASVTNSLMDKPAAKCHIKKPKIPERSVDSLMERLDLIKQHI